VGELGGKIKDSNTKMLGTMTLLMERMNIFSLEHIGELRIIILVDNPCAVLRNFKSPIDRMTHISLFYYKYKYIQI
jgi:hypothetical protein